MEVIKKGGYLIIVAVMSMAALMLPSGCRHTPDERLLQAESIMEEHPDSALNLLVSMQIPDKAPKEDIVLYGLLLTYAQYKNFIDVDSDSLVRTAAIYFSEKGNAEEASKAYFLMGMIQLDAHRFGEAAVSFTRGLDIAREKQIYFWQGQCARGLFILYGDLLDSSSQLKYSHEAYAAFSKGRHKDWMDYAKLNIARAYNNNGQYDMAIPIASEIKERSKVTSDSIVLEESSTLLALSLFGSGKYKESVDAYAEAYKLNPDMLTPQDKTNVHFASSKINKDTLSPETLTAMEKIMSHNDQHKSFSVLASNGQYEEAYRCLENYKNMQDSIIAQILLNNVSESVYQYKENLFRITQEKEHLQKAVTYSLFIIILMFGLISILILKINLHRKEARIAELAIGIDNLKQNLRFILDNNRTNDEEKREPIKESYTKILKETYSEINILCDRYYQSPNIKAFNNSSHNEIEKIIRNFTNIDYLKKIEEYVDSISNQLYSSFSKETFGQKEDNRRLFLLYLIGFNPRSISVLMKQNISAIYNKKSRLKSAINSSNVARRDEYLSALK